MNAVDLEYVDRLARQAGLSSPHWRKVGPFWYRVRDGRLSEVFDPFNDQAHAAMVAGQKANGG